MSNDKPIKDGVYGCVSGTAGRAFSTKNGGAFEMEVKDDRQQYGDKWTVWGDLPVTAGDRISVKGWLSISRETYEKDGETKVAIKRAINKPELAAHEPQSGHQGQQDARTTPSSPPAETWAPAAFNDATPF